MDVKEPRHILSLTDILSELDFLQVGLSEELAVSVALQLVFAIQSLSTTLDISIATSDAKIQPENIHIDDRGSVSVDAPACITDWQSRQPCQHSSQGNIFQSNGDPNLWLRSNLQSIIVYAEKLHISGCSSLTSTLASLIQRKHVDPCDVLAHVDIFSLFVTLFDKLGIVTGAQQTPLMILIKFHSRATKNSEWLSAYQARLELQDSCGRTALMYEAMHGNRDALLVLIPYEAACRTPQGYTALMYAASNHRFQCVLDLIPYEAGLASNNEDRRYGEGFTALMAAADAGAADIVSVLLPHEAWMRQKPNEEFPLGKRAYDYAIMRNRTLCVQMIQRYAIESYA